MTYAKIEDHPNLVRDLETNVLLNTDKKAITEFNLRRKKILEEKQNKEQMQQRLNSIENEMQELKSLLKDFIRSQNAN
jgi:hypothetical protein